MMTDAQKIAENFQFEGSFVLAKPFGCGHINDTYLVVYKTDGGEKNTLCRALTKTFSKTLTAL